jgi:hypothetical protein
MEFKLQLGFSLIDRTTTETKTKLKLKLELHAVSHILEVGVDLVNDVYYQDGNRRIE